MVREAGRVKNSTIWLLTRSGLAKQLIKYLVENLLQIT